MTGGARRVTTPDGVDLALHRLRAYRDGRPAVLLVHGAFTNHHFWLHAGMAHFLGAAGFDIWLADRGGAPGRLRTGCCTTRPRSSRACARRQTARDSPGWGIRPAAPRGCA